MTRYRYTGPPSGATISGRELLLFPGGTVELEPGHDYTRTLLAQGLLTDAPAPAPTPRARKEPA